MEKTIYGMKIEKKIMTTAVIVLKDGSNIRISTSSIEDCINWLTKEIKSCERDAIKVKDICSITFVETTNVH
jgi:hypothetical protein